MASILGKPGGPGQFPTHDLSTVRGALHVAGKSKKRFRPTDELWLVIHGGTRMSERTLEFDGVEDFRPIVGLDHSKFDRIFVLTYLAAYEWSRTTDWRQLCGE